jgi:hypothetical protein
MRFQATMNCLDLVYQSNDIILQKECMFGLMFEIFWRSAHVNTEEAASSCCSAPCWDSGSPWGCRHCTWRWTCTSRPSAGTPRPPVAGTTTRSPTSSWTRCAAAAGIKLPEYFESPEPLPNSAGATFEHSTTYGQKWESHLLNKRQKLAEPLITKKINKCGSHLYIAGAPGKAANDNVQRRCVRSVTPLYYSK